MPKKEKKKKKGIGFLGAIVAGVTILVGISASSGKTGGQPVEPGNGNGNGGETPEQIEIRRRDCFRRGGIFNESNLKCEFPTTPGIGFLDSAACGLLSKSHNKGEGFYHVTQLARNVQWSATFKEALLRPGAFVFWEAGFDVLLRNWLQCRLDAGEIG